MNKKITITLSDEEWQALCGDAEINIRDAVSHIHYLIKFNLLGYRDIRIENLTSRLWDIYQKLESIDASALAMFGQLQNLKSDVTTIADEIEKVLE